MTDTTDNNIGMAWDYLVDHEIATTDELKLVTAICGYNMDAMQGVLYARTAYRNFAQVEEESND